MNIQVTILKILASYPDGFANLNELKTRNRIRISISVLGAPELY